MNTVHIDNDEGQLICLLVTQFIQSLPSQDQEPWTPKARKIRKEMMIKAHSIKAKLQLMGFDCDIPDVDLNNFLTKES